MHTKKKWFDGLKLPCVGMAPMDGITDPVFCSRLLDQPEPPDVLFTEFISAEGLASGAKRLFTKLQYPMKPVPVIAQLFGKNPQAFYTSTQIAVRLGFAGVDINMGCPAKRVVGHGGGAALIGNPSLAVAIIRACQQALHDTNNTPGFYTPTLSVKTRLGLTSPNITTWLPVLCAERLDFITLHARTLAQVYSGLADWAYVQKANSIAKKYGIRLIGNGDVQSRADGLRLATKYHLLGVLIGRAAWGAPWVFSNLTPDFGQRLGVISQHLAQHSKQYGPKAFPAFKKHLARYLSGFPDAAAVRKSLLTSVDSDQLAQSLKLLALTKL